MPVTDMAGAHRAWTASAQGLAVRTAIKRLMDELEDADVPLVEADGKSGTLLAELFDFHRAYTANMPLAEALPGVHAAFADRYQGLGLKDLADEMHEFLSGYDTAKMQAAISATLPEPASAPAAAFASQVRGETELVPLGGLEGRVSAVTCLLYPPGIPVVVPGERFDAQVRPIIDYLALFERWDSRFPGFENEVQGVVQDRQADGAVRFRMSCVTD